MHLLSFWKIVKSRKGNQKWYWRVSFQKWFLPISKKLRFLHSILSGTPINAYLNTMKIALPWNNFKSNLSFYCRATPLTHSIIFIADQRGVKITSDKCSLMAPAYRKNEAIKFNNNDHTPDKPLLQTNSIFMQMRLPPPERTLEIQSIFQFKMKQTLQ